jgi:hypothetical protein
MGRQPSKRLDGALSVPQLAALIGQSHQAIYARIAEGTGPKTIPAGREVVVPLCDAIFWLERQCWGRRGPAKAKLWSALYELRIEWARRALKARSAKRQQGWGKGPSRHRNGSGNPRPCYDQETGALLEAAP